MITNSRHVISKKNTIPVIRHVVTSAHWIMRALYAPRLHILREMCHLSRGNFWNASLRFGSLKPDLRLIRDKRLEQRLVYAAKFYRTNCKIKWHTLQLTNHKCSRNKLHRKKSISTLDMSRNTSPLLKFQNTLERKMFIFKAPAGIDMQVSNFDHLDTKFRRFSRVESWKFAIAIEYHE